MVLRTQWTELSSTAKVSLRHLEGKLKFQNDNCYLAPTWNSFNCTITLVSSGI